ncbi:MAG: hypothetical protein WDO69_14120 [Pseudomonadota bacterium]
MKRNQIGSLVFGTLVLSSCYLAACAVGVDNSAIGPGAGESGLSTAGAGDSGVSGASDGGPAGSTGAAGRSAGGASAGTSAGGATGAGGKGAGGATGAGGKGAGGATGAGGKGAGGATGAGGKGAGGATGAGGKGAGGATGAGGSGVGGATGAAGKGGGTAGTGGAGTTNAIDLSTFQPVSAGTYNGTTHTLAVVAQVFFQFPLPHTFTTGQSLAVHVVGTNNGTAGLRSWLVDSSQTTLSNVVTTYVGAGLPSGSFTLDYTLTATGSAGLLFYKGPSFGTNIDSVTISSISVTY